ncbi:MAG: hypothetical protein IH934_03225 [Nanoarchaeota archaeon]|nr:hypothetical protein [Nanoarchaeota archaeon]
MDNRSNLGLYTIEQIIELRLRGLQRGRTKPSKFSGLEQRLDGEINKVAEEEELPSTLQHYFAYLHLNKGMSLQEMSVYLGNALDQPHLPSGSDLVSLLKEMAIPVRSIGQAMRLKAYQQMVLPESGLSDNELAMLVCTARGYVSPTDAANILKITKTAVDHRRTKIFDIFEEYGVNRGMQAAVEYFISMEWHNNPKVIENFKHIPTKTY